MRAPFWLLSGEERQEIMDEFVGSANIRSPMSVFDYVDDFLEESDDGGPFSDVGWLVIFVVSAGVYFFGILGWIGRTFGPFTLGSELPVGVLGIVIGLIVIIVVAFGAVIGGMLTMFLAMTIIALLFRSPFIIIDRITYAVQKHRLMKAGRKQFGLLWNPKAARRLLGKL